MCELEPGKPTYQELEASLKDAQDTIEKLTTVTPLMVDQGKDSLDAYFGVPNWAMEYISGSLIETMEPAPNYLEVVGEAPVSQENLLNHGATISLTMGQFVITVQRKEGKTPTEMRLKAEEERNVATHNLARVEKELNEALARIKNLESKAVSESQQA